MVPTILDTMGDALAEAAYAQNELQQRFDDEYVLAHYIQLARELKKLPVSLELRRRAMDDPTCHPRVQGA